MSATTTHDVILDVPFYSQLDPLHGLSEFWRPRSCSIFALKMVLDYWRLKDGLEPIPAKKLLSEADVVGARNEKIGWVHATIVATARSHGFIAWRRGWMLSEDGRTRFEAEGAGPRTLSFIDAQHRQEAYPTIVQALETGYPVLVSVPRNFNEFDKAHMIVLTGLRRGVGKDDYKGFYYHDPYSPVDEIDRKDQYITLADFAACWRSQGIFVIPNTEE